MRSIFSSKRIWILGIFILVIAAGVYAYTQYSATNVEQTPTSDLQTAVVRRGDLELLASGSATLTNDHQVSLGFGSSGPIAELDVQAGDKVEEGQVLALEGDMEQFQASVAADQLSVLEAQQAMDDLYNNADLQAAQAMLDLANAQDAVDSATYSRYVQQEGNRASQSTIDAAKAKLVLAQDQLDMAKEEYNKYYGRPKDDPARALATTKLASAQNAYDSALRNLNWYLGQPTDTQQMELDAQVAIAQANLAAAQREYDRLKDGPDPDEISKAELVLSDAQAKLAISQQNLEEATIVAPIAGTVLEVNGEVGQTVSGDFITVADLTQPSVEIYLDETDLDKMVVGNDVEVTFDALPDTTFTGHLVQVDPSLISSQGFSTLHGTALLDANTDVDLSTLPVGLNGSVDVIAGRALNAVLVPYEALRELSPGEYAVFVQENGELKLRPVEVGLMDFSFAEILSGLEPGEVVTTGIVQTQ